MAKLMPREKSKLTAIRSFVHEQRKIMGIKELKGPLFEISCEGYGEFRNLLDRNLLHNPEENWAKGSFEKGADILHPPILNGVYREVMRRIKKSPGKKA